MIQMIQTITDWISSNNTWVAIVISVISLVITFHSTVSKWNSEKINLIVEVKNCTKLNSPENPLFIELAITNMSNLPITLLNLNLSLENIPGIGLLHDKSDLFYSKDDNKVYLSDFPKTIQPLGSSRFWVRFDFDQTLPESLENNKAKLQIVCFNKNKSFDLTLPKYATFMKDF